jgi:hypothetical protein
MFRHTNDMATMWAVVEYKKCGVGFVIGGSIFVFCIATELFSAGFFSFHHCVQNGSGAHPASYPMGTSGSFPVVKWPGCEADYSPPSSAKVKECVELYFHSPNMPSWHGAC